MNGCYYFLVLILKIALANQYLLQGEESDDFLLDSADQEFLVHFTSLISECGMLVSPFPDNNTNWATIYPLQTYHCHSLTSTVSALLPANQSFIWSTRTNCIANAFANIYSLYIYYNYEHFCLTSWETWRDEHSIEERNNYYYGGGGGNDDNYVKWPFYLLIIALILSLCGAGASAFWKNKIDH